MIQSLKVFLMASVIAMTGLAHAESNHPPLNFSPWKLLLQSAMVSKNSLAGNDGTNYSILTRYNGLDASADLTQSHRSDYFSLVSLIGPKGALMPYYVSAVSENWKLEGDTWTIEQWIYQVSLAGEVTKVAHQILVEKTSGSVVDVQELPVTDAEKEEKWSATLKEWQSFASEIPVN